MLVVGALLCAAPALPAAPPATAPEAIQPVTPTPDADRHRPARSHARPAPPVPVHQAPATATPAPHPQPAVHRVAVRVDAAAPDAAPLARTVPGVAHVAAIRVGRLVAGTGPEELVVASVDPSTYRPFAPSVVAENPGVWARLSEGELVVMHEHAQRLGLQLGGPVTLGGVHGVVVRVGALASNGAPPVAQAIVGHRTGSQLGLGEVPTTLLVAVGGAADPADVAARLTERLGASATVVPDPRAPAPVAPAPPRGDTVWDVLAACEASGDWHANTGNGYYGGLQFLPESWWLVGGQGMPHAASREEQIVRAERLLDLQGWVAWPVCSVRVGLRPPPHT